MAGVLGAAVLCDLRPRQLVGHHARQRAVDGFRVGAAGAVLAVDDLPVLDDQRVLRAVAVPRAQPAHAGPACAAAGDCHAHRLQLLHRLAAALQLRAAAGRGGTGLPVQCAARLRPAVQPGTLAAHRAGGDPVGLVSPVHSAPVGTAGAASVGLRHLRLGAHDVAAPLHRHPDRRTARPVLRVAVAAGTRGVDAARMALHAGRPALEAGGVLCGRRGAAPGCRAAWWRRRAVARMAGRIARAGGAELRRLRRSRLSNGRPGPHGLGSALDVGALPARRRRQRLALDAQVAGLGRSGARPAARPPPDARRMAGRRAAPAGEPVRRAADAGRRAACALRAAARPHGAVHRAPAARGGRHRKPAAQRGWCDSVGLLRARLLAQRGRGDRLAGPLRRGRRCRPGRRRGAPRTAADRAARCVAPVAGALQAFAGGAAP